MCGIFGYLGKEKDLSSLIINGLKALEYRGYDSWGIAIKDKSKLFIHKKTGKIGRAHLKKVTGKVGIGHTRWATHGNVTVTNAHPQFDCKKEVVIVHNGIVENFTSLKKELQRKGHHFTSQTDTEVIAHLVEDKLKHYSPRKAVEKSFQLLKGLNAVIVFLPKRELFLAIKNSSPLIIGKGREGIFLASDIAALVGHVDEIYHLNDEELILVKKEKIQLFDKKGKEKNIKFSPLNLTPASVSLGNYPHYMLKEINEQPLVIENIKRNYKSELKKFANLIKQAYGVYFIGCGTAYFAALAGTYIFSKIAKRHVNASVASEFSYLKDFLKKDSLIVALSQSGETIDTISAIKAAKEKSSRTVAITNVPNSTLYRMTDYKILLNAGPEKCVLATKSFTAKIAILYLTAHLLNDSYNKGLNNITKAIREIKNIIASKKIKEIARKIKDKKHIFLLGRGVSYPTALESALKIKEVSYLHAEGFPAGELKHGVIALIEKGTPVIIYNPKDETFEDTLSSAYEVKARGAFTIGIGAYPDKVFDEFIKINDCGDATIIPNVVVAQLLGYYLAIERHLDPDKPRNLAKSVTVK